MRATVVLLACFSVLGCTDPGSPGRPGSTDAAPAVCAPAGSWRLTYSGAPAGAAPTDDTLTVANSDGGGGGLQAAFAGIEPPASACGPGEQSSLVQSAQLEAAACTLTVDALARWCTSGEAQCRHRQLTLTFDGDRASGKLEYRACWAGSPQGTTYRLDARANRQ